MKTGEADPGGDALVAEHAALGLGDLGERERVLDHPDRAARTLADAAARELDRNAEALGGGGDRRPRRHEPLDVRRVETDL